MLQIKNLTITHKKDLRVMLEDFQFTLNPGDKAVLIGEEGNGKSTLLKWIYDPEIISEYTDAQGERICTGERIGYLPQELPSVESGKSIYEFFTSDELFWEQEPRDLSKLAKDLSLPVDFFYGEQKMSTLSGGEKVKAQIARILMAKPTILLLDEPSNDIDTQTLEWLEHFILEAEQGVLYISHDETLIERTANVVIHLEQIRRKTKCRYTVARMPYVDYIDHRNAVMQNQQRNAENAKRHEAIQQEKLRRIMQKVEYDQENITWQNPSGGRLLKKKMKAVKSMEKRFEREAENMTQMPEEEEAIFLKFGQKIQIPAGKVILDYHLEQLPVPDSWNERIGVNKCAVLDGCSISDECTVSDKRIGLGKRTMLNERIGQDGGTVSDERVVSAACIVPEQRILSKNIHLIVKGAEKICIIGRNGAGKTTLLRRIAEMLLEREDIKAAYMPQNYEDLLDMDKTPVEYLCQSGDKEEVTRIRTYLGSMKYTADEVSHKIAELSGGQKAKVLLLKMSLSGANVLILDEPTRNFSPLSGPVIREVLREYRGAIISISHDRKYISEVCDSIYELTEDGLRILEKM